MKRQEMILGYVLVLISGFFYWKTFQLPEDARLYPLFVITLLLLLSILHLILTYRKSEDEFTSGGIDLSPEQIKQGLLITVASALYVFVIQKLGYVVSTVIYVAAVLYGLEVEKKKVVLISVIFTALVYLLFNNLLKVPLPTGLLI